MQWIQVEIEDQCDIVCRQCSQVLIDLNNIDVYGEWTDRMKGRQAYVFVSQLKINKERFELQNPQLSNEPSHFLMYLQRIKCSFCSNKIGIFFTTVNPQNMFALNKYAFDLSASRLKDSSHKIIFQMLRQEIDKSKQSMVRKEYKQKEQRKHGPSVEHQLQTISNLQRGMIQKAIFVQGKIVKEIQKRLNKSSHQ